MALCAAVGVVLEVGGVDVVRGWMVSLGGGRWGVEKGRGMRWVFSLLSMRLVGRVWEC